MPMKTIRPNRAELYLWFTCPSCGAEHMATIEETQFPGGVLCYCKERLRFVPVTGADVSLRYVGQARPVDPREGAAILPRQRVDDGVIAVQGLLQVKAIRYPGDIC